MEAVEANLGMDEKQPFQGLGRLRSFWSTVGVVTAASCAMIAAATLLIIFGYVIVKGFTALNLAFFIALPRPVGFTGGGVANGIVGSAIMVSIAAILATPIGVLCGVYLSLFGRGFMAEGLRFLADVLSGVPSIVIGLFAYTLLVAPLKHFSAFSAAFAFAILMLPIIVRTSEEAVRSVPTVIREGALALGMSVYTATTKVVLPAARGAIPRYGGNRSAAVHRLRQSVLGSEPGQSNGRTFAAGFHVRHLSLRRLAPPSMGRCTGSDRGRIHHQLWSPLRSSQPSSRVRMSR